MCKLAVRRSNELVTESVHLAVMAMWLHGVYSAKVAHVEALYKTCLFI